MTQTLIEHIAAQYNYVRSELSELDRTKYGYTALDADIIERAQALHAHGVLSRRNIESILNLSERSLEKIIEKEKNSRIGGRLDPDTIAYLLEAHNAWKLQDNAGAKSYIRACVPATSGRMASRLTGIPYGTLYRWIPVA